MAYGLDVYSAPPYPAKSQCLDFPLDLSSTSSGTTIFTYFLSDSNEYALTQSQMLNSVDSDSFLQAQVIHGLGCLGEFDYKNISSLPPHA